MRNVAPVAVLLALTFCSVRANAEDEPQIITPEGLATSQMLPSLDGSVADLPLSVASCCMALISCFHLGILSFFL